jgi:excisionase family DNA binding protein
VIDLVIETLLTIEKAAERLLVSEGTLHRWISKGSNGVRLEAVKVGNRWRTSEEAIQRFSESLTPTHKLTASPQTPVSTSKEMQRRVERMRQQLDEMDGTRRCETCKAEIKAPGRVIPKHEQLWCSKCLVERKSASLGQRIRTFRWAATMSQEELSDRTGISINSIRCYEHKRKVPTEAHLAKLIDVLGEELVSNY